MTDDIESLQNSCPGSQLGDYAVYGAAVCSDEAISLFNQSFS
jgi:hypothetical protein